MKQTAKPYNTGPIITHKIRIAHRNNLRHTMITVTYLLCILCNWTTQQQNNKTNYTNVRLAIHSPQYCLILH